MTHTTLVCLGFAGAGSSFFHPWREQLPPGLSLLAPQLPGREWRIGEAPPASIAEAVESLLPELLSGTEGQRVALFGQCFGAVVAFELARELLEHEKVDVVHLFASGSPGPWIPREHWAIGSDDDYLVDRVRDDAGYQHEALQVPELRELILPALRADMESHERYVPAATTPLDVPITALRGRDDRIADADGCLEWRSATTAEFTLQEFPGGHMYLVERAGPLLELVEKTTRPD